MKSAPYTIEMVAYYYAYTSEELLTQPNGHRYVMAPVYLFMQEKWETRMVFVSQGHLDTDPPEVFCCRHGTSVPGPDYKTLPKGIKRHIQTLKVNHSGQELLVAIDGKPVEGSDLTEPQVVSRLEFNDKRGSQGRPYGLRLRDAFQRDNE